jgi:predicted phosphodiesterase
MNSVSCSAAAFLIAVCLLAGNAPAADQQNKKPQGPGQKNRAKEPQGGQPQAESFKTDVPAHDIDVILARPTNTSVTLSVLAYRNMEIALSYGTRPGAYDSVVTKRMLGKGKPLEIFLAGLSPDTQYYYKLAETSGTPPAHKQTSIEGAFHTQRGPGSSFVFTVIADSHLDQRTDTEIYRTTLANAAADKPDFHIDMGDTFMTEKHHTQANSLPQYLAQRYYFGLLCSSAPLYLVIGNHDGETLREFDGTPSAIGLWASAFREQYFPNPVPDSFYSGDSVPDKFGQLPQDYYSWQWGDALFVVLDPYRFTPPIHISPRDNWARSLGEKQYYWLRDTLEHSKAKYKFIFIHQLVGGFTNNGRSGAEAAPFYEWGGKNEDGTSGFAANRPEWPEPLHQLFVRTGVSAVFHGHDHLFASQELDGILYQEIPQPGSYTNLRNGRAAEDGYTKGTILGGAGCLRVTVSSANAKVDYISTFLPADERNVSKNGQSAFSYTITPHTDSK